MKRQAQNISPSWLNNDAAESNPTLPLEELDAEIIANRLRVLAHPHRLEIICLLAYEPATVTSLAVGLDLPQTTISKHLHLLRQAEFVTAKRQGTGRLYHLAKTGLATSILALAGQLDD